MSRVTFEFKKHEVSVGYLEIDTGGKLRSFLHVYFIPDDGGFEARDMVGRCVARAESWKDLVDSVDTGVTKR